MTLSRCGAAVVLVRHGQPEGVLPKSFLGHSDPQLNALGREQAAAAAQLVHGLVADGKLPPPTALWHSDLQRAAQTALPIASAFKLQGRSIAAMREIDFGAWDGQTFEQVNAANNNAASAWFTNPTSIPPPDGESLDDVYQRVEHFVVSELLGLPSNSSAIVVAHFGSLAMLSAVLLGLSPKQALGTVLQRGQCGYIVDGALRWWGLPHV